MENATGAAARECLHSLFEASVRRDPGAVALIDGALALTYAQLDVRAEAAARGLLALGGGPGAVVCVAARRRADTIAALLGVLKAGAVYCPLDPAYPLELLRFMLEDSGASALIAGRADARTLSAPERPTILFEDIRETGHVRPAAAPRDCAPSDLAYVIYTSGSTGQPKGVMIEHASAANFARAVIKMEDIRPGERTLLFSSMSFDASVFELFPCLCAGASLFLPDDAALYPPDFVQSLRAARIARLFLPTAYWHELAAALAPLGETLPECLRSVVVGGSAMLAESLAYWRPAAGRVRLFNGYGPTEATVGCSFYEVPADAPSAGLVPIGLPSAGAELHVVDPEGRLVPHGSAGELWIGGPGVARGYLNRPELTAGRFVPDNFSGRAGARLYRTGDRVRRRPDGVFEFLGRFDEQVKVRGYRVELGEVEAALASHPAVGTCAVVLREEASGVQRLIAYVSPRAGATASASALRAFLAGKIPGYMVPSLVVTLPVLPLTPRGKIDRGALPPPAAEPPPEAVEERELTALERQIRGIWEEVFGVSPIGLRDEFYALGGHSLLAVRMMAHIEKTVGRRLPLTALCAGVTIESLAKMMGEEARTEAAPVIRFGPETGADPIFFIHPGLGGLYCQGLSRAMPNRPIYLLVPQDITELDPLPTIEEMARRHVETIRRVSSRGPYRLGGYSIGSTIAYEMARQLHAAGAQVPDLMLVAAPIGDSSSWWGAVRRAVGLIGGLSGQDRTAMLERFYRWGKSGELASGLFKRGGVARLREAIGRAFARVNTEGSIRAFGPNALEQETLKSLIWAWAGYRPGPYRGHVTLLEVKDKFRQRKKTELRRLSPSVEQVWLPGDHNTIVTTYVAELGAEIGSRLSSRRRKESLADPGKQPSSQMV